MRRKAGIVLLLCLLSFALVLALSLARPQVTTAAKYPEFKDAVIGLELYVEEGTDEKIRLVNIDDKNIASKLMSYLDQSPHAQPPSVWPWKKYYLVFKVQEAEEVARTREYVYLFKDFAPEEPGYLALENTWYQVPPQFNIVLLSLTEYKNATSEVDPDDVAFLRQYGWEVLFKANTMEGKLPDELVHNAGDFPVVIYWAYNNELSKDVGLDITPYLGKEVRVNLYKLEQPLPEFMHGFRWAGRAVIVKAENRIVGAWLDAGKNQGFACSLKGRRLEEITGKSWGEWLKGLINTEDPLEKRLSSLGPEELIRTFYQAVGNGDKRTAHAALSRRNLLDYLFRNMDNNRLYNPSFSVVDRDGLNNVAAAKIVSIRELPPQEKDTPEIKRFQVAVHLTFRRAITAESGVQVLFLTLRQEIPGMGWRIDSIGFGP
ncbi:MAG: DUF4830 domain-containing protein [Thermanaeromonas sp.]|uniref:DUF4829 domain-containing protein n=1 Tax=Thermanaeromonas sp. TaxID=2003697 RepID=UPI00243CAD21|nr:DUF4829 domain-containing protein [Thermanaeromonas sp.]MCG0278485.1 DUF4830 domain-containing protein [Thermanaeromonas sp.]